MALFLAFHAALAATGRATYDEGAAHMFYKLSTASYCSSADLAAWDCPPCAATKLKAASAPKTFYDKATGARGYVGAFTGANSSDMLVLAFEGSENVENWIENLKIAKTEYAAPPVEPWTGCQTLTVGACAQSVASPSLPSRRPGRSTCARATTRWPG